MYRIDAHAYIGEDLFGLSRSPDQLLKDMDRLEIAKAVLCPNKPPNYELENANRFVVDQIKLHPDRFMGWARVDPWQKEKALDLLKRGVEEWGLIGLLLHPYEERFQASLRLVDPLMEYASRMNLPVMIESGYFLLSHPLDVAELATRFPSVAIIGTHGLQLDDAAFAMTDASLALNECPNLFIDTAGVYAPDSIISTINNLGENRVIFGSHSPWLSLELEIDRVDYLDLESSAKEAIFSKNLLKLFNKK